MLCRLRALIIRPHYAFDTRRPTPTRREGEGSSAQGSRNDRFPQPVLTTRGFDTQGSHPLAYSLPDTIGLYSERFHGLLTLSSECFSTFPHGTCSLSVLWKYLALDRVYDLLSAACSSNATLRERGLAHSTLTRAHTGLTPSVEIIPPLVGTANSWLT